MNEDKTIAILKYGTCRGHHRCKNIANEDHTCPYSEEIHNDHYSLCNCCDDCTRECAHDI